MLLCTLSIPTYSGDNSIIETKFSTKTTRLLLPIKYDTLSTTTVVNEYNNNEYVDTPLIINTNATSNAVNKSLTLFDTNTANEYVISKALSPPSSIRSRCLLYPPPSIVIHCLLLAYLILSSMLSLTLILSCWLLSPT